MRVSASRVALLLHCAFWARPDVKRPRRIEKRITFRGTILHRIVEAHCLAVLGERSFPNHREFVTGLAAGDASLVIRAYEAFATHPIAGVGWIPEVSFAYDPQTDTSRQLPVQHERDYSAAREGEICGTPDGHLFDANARVVHVVDWKTGAGNNARDQLSDLQGVFNGLSLARAYGAREAVISEVDLTIDGPQIKQRVLNAQALNEAAVLIRALVAKIPDSEPQPGAHCSALWCPVQALCPATVRASHALLPGTHPAMRIETTEQATNVHLALQMARARFEMYAAELNRFTDDQGGSWTMTDGRTFRRSESHPRSIDLAVPGAKEALVQLGFGRAIEETVSASSLLRAAQGPQVSKAAAEREVDQAFAALAELGAVRLGTTVTYEAHGKIKSFAEGTRPAPIRRALPMPVIKTLPAPANDSPEEPLSVIDQVHF